MAAGAAAVVGVALLGAGPAQAQRPAFIPDTTGSTILLLPGTGDRDGADQIGRTVGVGWFDDATVANGRVVVVDYPAAFGIRLLGVLVPFVGDATYNESAVAGTANLVAAAEPRLANGDRVVLNGFSQSATPVMSAAYLLHQADPGNDGRLSVIVGADPRFPNTGAEVVMPSIIPGLYTNGERDTAGTGDIPVTSICVVGDTTCGMANPLVHPISWAFYFLPGFYVHGNMYDDAGTFTQVDEFTSGNTTFVVLDGGNPWGMMLRDLGVPVPREVDDVLNVLIPRQMPGQPDTVFGYEVPTPRAIQASLYRALGWSMPVTDPDVVGTPGTSSTPAGVTATTPTTTLAAATGPAAAASAAPTDPTARRSSAADAAPARTTPHWASRTPSWESRQAQTPPWQQPQAQTPPWEQPQSPAATPHPQASWGPGATPWAAPRSGRAAPESSPSPQTGGSAPQAPSAAAGAGSH
ncbi:hypothetical protein nbrc107697_01410 [Gordonia crocea]|uniref:PE-PPE domain-containing protein n=1 Tax=Gordonia crocea TaxID=589162 RepID=A0A7M3STX8_9ACTN|nr:hypothetical protein nbrc107697_01410 [Gordonia crocea]